MPSIYLKETGRTYDTGATSVTVACEPYSPSNLFTRYKHKPPSSGTGNIYIHNGKNRWSNAFIITTSSTHTSAKLKEAHVYVNKYDDKNTPLILVLIFENGGGSSPGNKYYKRSQFSTKFTDTQSVEISSLTKYTNEQNILDKLLEENDKLDDILTYNIGRTKGDNNGNGDGKYNGEKICVEDDTTKGSPKLSGTGFNRYKHTPVNGGVGKKACVIYDGNVLVDDGQDELTEIQGKVYTSIVVYMGTKAKKKDATSGTGQGLSDTYPLLIELTKTSSSSEPEYYVHKRKSNTGGSPEYYWEPLQGSGAGNTLEGLLIDMGFSTENGEPGYKELKSVLTGAGVSVDDGGDLSEKLSLKGSELQKLLSQTVGESSGTGSQKSFLELLLQKIEFDLLDSIVILLEKNTGTTYGDGEVAGPVSGLVPPKEINVIEMGGQNITVNDETGTNGLCVQKFGYKLIKHDFGELVSNGFGSSGQSTVGIRFIIPSESSDSQYKQLKLYDKKEPYPQNLQYTYHSSGQNEVYVYYYGEKDPRPLLVCYNGCSYKPRNLNKDNPDNETQVNVKYSTWVKIEGITQCTCQNGGTSGPPNKDILDALTQITGFLNPVQINPTQIPNSASTQITQEPPKSTHYVLHTYNTTTKIKMGITRQDVGCYEKYTYQPYGTTSGPAQGFRLGTVFHAKTGSSSTRSTLEYTTLSQTYKYYPLVGVTVYYYDADKEYNDPLLIELEFKKNGGGSTDKEYYKLQPSSGGSAGTLKWDKDPKAPSAINGPDGGDNTQKIVDYLDSIRHSLKKVVKILIDQQNPYNLCLSKELGASANGYSPYNSGSTNIQVEDCKDNGCSELSKQGYICYQHKVSNIGNGFDYNKIGGLKFYITGKNGEGGSSGDQDIEIKLTKITEEVAAHYHK